MDLFRQVEKKIDRNSEAWHHALEASESFPPFLDSSCPINPLLSVPDETIFPDLNGCSRGAARGKGQPL